MSGSGTGARVLRVLRVGPSAGPHRRARRRAPAAPVKGGRGLSAHTPSSPDVSST